MNEYTILIDTNLLTFVYVDKIGYNIQGYE
jgi:rRNA-processing protein FCF1